MEIPALVPIRQVYDQPAIEDVAAEVRRQWLGSALARRLRKGDRVLIGVGSRGVANLAVMVKSTIEAFRELGARPEVVAAMGSHGGATAQGQRELLAEYGVTAEALGVPVLTDMDAVQVGVNSWGQPVWWDRNALGADHVVTLSRVKIHTDFHARYESGIVKMIVIGLGKRPGAALHHSFGVRGLKEMMPETCRVVLEKTPFAGGLAIVENASEQTAVLRYVDRSELLEEEPKLLAKAYELMARIPFHQLDLLIVGEIGKNYSGGGMDPNVVGRMLVEGEPELETPKITRICVLDLAPESHGNATGVGIGDLTTDRLLAKIDPVPFRMNNLTACFLWRSKLPLAFPNDRECIEAGIRTCWQPDLAALRMAAIANTLEMVDLWVSPSMLDEVRQNPGLRITGDARPMPFDADGNLAQETLFPHALRSRRAVSH